MVGVPVGRAEREGHWEIRVGWGQIGLALSLSEMLERGDWLEEQCRRPGRERQVCFSREGVLCVSLNCWWGPSYG